jgi:uncharacterized protein YwgA
MKENENMCLYVDLCVLNKIEVEERLRLDEKRRAILPKRTRAQPVFMSQADRLLEAKQTERENLAELEKFKILEEEERRKRRTAWSTQRKKYPLHMDIFCRFDGVVSCP